MRMLAALEPGTPTACPAQRCGLAPGWKAPFVAGAPQAIRGPFNSIRPSRVEIRCPTVPAALVLRGALSLFRRAYIYYENELRPAISRKLLTKDEARRIAANIAKLPELLSKS